LRTFRREGFSPADIAEFVLRPVFGENGRTDELERWLDRHTDAIERGADEETAIMVADKDLIFDGLDWRVDWRDPGKIERS
jgi:hypothetical protein